MAGRGVRGENCGRERVFHCLDCGHDWRGEEWCRLRTCPACVKRWARAEARIVRGRVFDRRAGRRVIHTILSPSNQEIPRTAEEYRALRSRAYEVLVMAGLEGGALIFHPNRDGDDGLFTVEGPHFHHIGLARGLVASGDEIFKATGWVLKNTRRRNGKISVTFGQAYRLIYYMLEHSGIADGVHGVTWWGCCSYASGKAGDLELEARDARDRRGKTLCPSCGSSDVIYQGMIDHTAWDHPIGVRWSPGEGPPGEYGSFPTVPE